MLILQVTNIFIQIRDHVDKQQLQDDVDEIYNLSEKRNVILGFLNVNTYRRHYNTGVKNTMQDTVLGRTMK